MFGGVACGESACTVRGAECGLGPCPVRGTACGESACTVRGAACGFGPCTRGAECGLGPWIVRGAVCGPALWMTIGADPCIAKGVVGGVGGRQLMKGAAGFSVEAFTTV